MSMACYPSNTDQQHSECMLPSYEHACSGSGVNFPTSSNSGTSLKAVDSYGPIGRVLRTHFNRRPSFFDQFKSAEMMDPRSVICDLCKTFHRRPNENENEEVFMESSKCAANLQTVSFGGRRQLPWWRAHLIMRAWRLSSEHGIPLTSTERIKSWSEEMWQFRSEKKIVNGRLLMKFHASKKLQLGNMHEGMLIAPACKHLRGVRAFHNATEQAVLTTAASSKATYQSRLLRCVWCPTEYRIIIDFVPVVHAEQLVQHEVLCEKEYRLTIISYTDLGTCESPLSREWYVVFLFI